jgi:hypothetical protein
MIPVSAFSTGQRGSDPPWAASLSKDVAMSAASPGSMVASSGTSLR